MTSNFFGDVNTLNVYSQIDPSPLSTQMTRIWSLKREQGNGWLFARISTSYNSDYRIIFEGLSLFSLFFFLLILNVF